MSSSADPGSSSQKFFGSLSEAVSSSCVMAASSLPDAPSGSHSDTASGLGSAAVGRTPRRLPVRRGRSSDRDERDLGDVTGVSSPRAQSR